MTTIKTLITLAILLVFMTQPSYATNQQTYHWEPPTEGTPVHHYLVQVSVDRGEFVTLTVHPDTAEVTLTFEDNREYLVRVKAVDADGIESEFWSPASDPFTFRRPGGCGKPWRG